MFSGPDIANDTYGSAPSRIYDDLKDTEEIRSIIMDNPKRLVDHLVLSQEPSKVKTALVVGPLIYGTGHGPVNTSSIQIPYMARNILKMGHGFQVGAGQSVWSNVHIHDLGYFFSLLLQAAAGQKQECWNHDGVYSVERGRLVSLL